MAKSIRLKSETQKRVIGEVASIHERTGLLVSDAKVVDMLVNEALDAREAVQPKKAVRK
jgi:nucleoside diphosphate kinase